MQLKPEQKKIICAAIAEDLKEKQKGDETYSQSSHARFLRINTGIYSRVVRGDIDKTLSSAEWVRVGRKLYVDLNEIGWKTAKTAVYQFVTGQLKACQEGSLWGLNCDIVSIGKTYSAEVYSKLNKNVIYVKCEEGVTRADLVRDIAESMGLDIEGKTVASIRKNIELQAYGLDKPLLILDDAGYMNDRCWMTVKGIYDATEGILGVYLIGDTSLRKKMEKLIAKDKSGWEALFDRMNRKYQSVSSMYESQQELETALKESAIQIMTANMPGAENSVKIEILKAAKTMAHYYPNSGAGDDAKKVFTHSLRVVKKEIMKQRAA